MIVEPSHIVIGFTLNKQGFGYIPKKGKRAFVQTKTTFVKSSGKPYCENARRLAMLRKSYPLIQVTCL